MSEAQEKKEKYNESSKLTTYKWREKNPELWKEQQKIYSKRYYEKNRQKCIDKIKENQKKQSQEIEEKLEELARYKEMYGDKLTTTVVQAGITT
jgi:hypothetical protein